MSQLLLPLKDFDWSILAAVRVRAACKVVAEELRQKVVGSDLWECSEAQVSLKLDQKNGHYMKPEQILALMRRDMHGRILAAICAELGYEMPERLHRLDPAEERDRLLAAAGELFGDDVLELLRRRAGVQ